MVHPVPRDIHKYIYIHINKYIHIYLCIYIYLFIASSDMLSGKCLRQLIFDKYAGRLNLTAYIVSPYIILCYIMSGMLI